ncbi:MAG: ABC transporter permease [Streptococcus sp.]|nr:ABC transporter permease [Streptococcus sp.]
MEKFFKQNIYSEMLKILYSRATIIVLSIIFILQPFLSYISSKQILATGLNATPETDGNLVEAIPPIEYIGFDAILFGLFEMIIWGAILGNMEYKNNSLRTSLILSPSKKKFFSSKFLATLIFISIISFISIYISIMCSQYALGKSGLNPFLLNNKIWIFILLGAISWTLLTLLSYSISFTFQSSAVSLIFLIPQLYNLGNFLVEKFALAKLLPINLGQDLIATSPDRLVDNPINSISGLVVWTVLFAGIAFYRFTTTDEGSV